jgi:hypothetical protein
MEHKQEVDFENGNEFDISLPFKTSEKNHCMRRWRLLFQNFYRQTCKAVELMCIFFDIVLERDVRNQAGILTFEFLDKMREIQYSVT